MSDNKKKRQDEERCIRTAIKQLPELHGYKIDTSRTEKGLEEERPDFILEKDGCRVGAEHFLVDTLLHEYHNKKSGEVKYDSVSRQLNSKMAKLFDKYKEGKIEGNEEKALNDIENLINGTFDAESNYEYNVFLQEFFRIFTEHMKNITAYRDKDRNNVCKLGFVCEVDIADAKFEWTVYNHETAHVQAINGIPMTFSMWLIIYTFLLIGFIDFFIITTIPVYRQSKAKSQIFTKDSVPKLFDAFEYRSKGVIKKVELKLED